MNADNSFDLKNKPLQRRFLFVVNFLAMTLLITWNIQLALREDAPTNYAWFINHSASPCPSTRPLFAKRMEVLPQDLVWSLEATRFGFRLFYRYKIWHAPGQQRCRSSVQTSQRYGHYNIQSHGFETSWDLAYLNVCFYIWYRLGLHDAGFCNAGALDMYNVIMSTVVAVLSTPYDQHTQSPHIGTHIRISI